MQKWYTNKVLLNALILAGVERFIAEFVRLNPPALFGLTEAQVTSILMAIGGFFLIYWVTHRSAAAEEEVVRTPNPVPKRKRRRRS